MRGARQAPTRPPSRRPPRGWRMYADVSFALRGIELYSHKAGSRTRGGAARVRGGCTCSGTRASTGCVELAIFSKRTHAMNRDWHTVTENRQIQQSVTLALLLRAVTAELWAPLSSSPPPSTFSCCIAFALMSAKRQECGAHLNWLSPRRCQSRPISTRILTQRYCSSVPPW